MPGETILLVDNSAVSLKLAAAALRGAGYRVQVASTGEQAISTLRTMRPNLVLLDLQLPGMDGLELTRHIREDPRTKHIVVVAMTASAARDSERLAIEAGCDGFLAKPIDSQTLERRVAAYLGGYTSAPAGDESDVPEELPFTGPEIEALRRTFLADGARQVRGMLEFMSTQLDPAAAARVFHQWIGAAGALGYKEIVDQARAAEALLARPQWTKAQLRDLLTSLAYAFATPKEAAPTPIPESIIQELDHRRVALVGFADEEADKVCAAFERARALPLLFDAGEPLDSPALRACSVILVHVRPETLSGNRLVAERTLPAELPLVLVGAREDLLMVDPKIQARACEFLIDGWQPEEVVMRISFAMSRARQAQAVQGQTASEAVRPARVGRPSVLVADDDATVVAVVRNLLETAGMDCLVATNGPEALRKVRESGPEGMVLDVNMPGMDGFEILANIRNDGISVKVLMLTARQQERDVLRGFELGADDYMIKPFSPMEMVARLKRLL